VTCGSGVMIPSQLQIEMSTVRKERTRWLHMLPKVKNQSDDDGLSPGRENVDMWETQGPRIHERRQDYQLMKFI